MDMLEIDVVVTHPEGITEEIRTELMDAFTELAESLGCSVGGSWDLVKEVT
jgi:hypothetical protein